MSWTQTLRLLGVAAILVAFMAPAAAGGRVDWSAYIDHGAPTTAQLAKTRTTAEPAPAKEKRTKKATKAKKKTAKSKATKARKKAGKKARRK